MEALNRRYLPAAGHDWALPLYDPLVKLLGADRARRALIEQAAIRPAHRILDVGCGTGTLVTLIQRMHPDVNIVGLDPDPKALRRAAQKAHQAGLSIRFDQGFSDELPYPDAAFDRVFSSFMFHHVPPDNRGNTLREIRRVLAPGGSLHLLDFERPEASAGGLLTRWIRSNPHLSDNSEQRILALLQQAGFICSEKLMRRALFFGLLPLGYYHARPHVTAGGSTPSSQDLQTQS